MAIPIPEVAQIPSSCLKPLIFLSLMKNDTTTNEETTCQFEQPHVKYRDLECPEGFLEIIIIKAEVRQTITCLIWLVYLCFLSYYN